MNVGLFWVSVFTSNALSSPVTAANNWHPTDAIILVYWVNQRWVTNVHFCHQDFRDCLVLWHGTNSSDPSMTGDWKCPGNCKGMLLLQRTGFGRLLSEEALWLIILFLVGFCSFIIHKESSGFSESKLPTEMTVVTVVVRAGIYLPTHCSVSTGWLRVSA